MKKTKSANVYTAAIYLRLSKEDGDFSDSGVKQESDSIANQRLLIHEFLKKHPEIQSTREYCDDGYTGTNFDRPAFQQMMEDVRNGQIQCILVKDLSRFGRDYIDSGKYIQKVFPALDVRFIAINDDYDSMCPSSGAELSLPIKNLMNDAYSRDTSIKVRTNLEAKRQAGEFVGSRVIYGYLRDPADRHHLIVDEQAAHVVQDIFRWKIEGLSPNQIANRLNDQGVLSPIEYKREKGSKQRTSFQTKPKALWSAVAIYRILRNEMYTGTLVQGKTTTPNYKVKKRKLKDRSEWTRTENAHERIITPEQFDLVQRLMSEDTRSPAGENGVHPFSGKIYCASCGSSMVRQVSRTGGKEYVYFICGGYKADRQACSPHRIREKDVVDSVLPILQAHIAVALNIEESMRAVDQLAWENRQFAKLQEQIAQQEVAAEKKRRLKTSAYEDWKLGIITREEYESFCTRFDQEIAQATETITSLKRQSTLIQGGLAEQQAWLAQFHQYKNIREMNRCTVVNLIEKITVNGHKNISVQLRYRDQFAGLQAYLQTPKTAPGPAKGAALFGREDA